MIVKCSIEFLKANYSFEGALLYFLMKPKISGANFQAPFNGDEVASFIWILNSIYDIVQVFVLLQTRTKPWKQRNHKNRSDIHKLNLKQMFPNIQETRIPISPTETPRNFLRKLMLQFHEATSACLMIRHVWPICLPVN